MLRGLPENNTRSVLVRGCWSWDRILNGVGEVHLSFSGTFFRFRQQLIRTVGESSRIYMRCKNSIINTLISR